MDRKLVASGIFEALEDADIEFRWLMPDLFVKVDHIKSLPNRQPQHEYVPVRNTGYRTGECLWCGDWFLSARINRVWAACCCQSCASRLRAFNHRRAS